MGLQQNGSVFCRNPSFGNIFVTNYLYMLYFTCNRCKINLIWCEEAVFMKLPWEKKYICYGIVAFCVVAAGIALYMLIHKWETVGGVISLIFKSLRPITYGLLFAYILNPLMRTIENHLVSPAFAKMLKNNRSRAESLSRASSIFLTWGITITALLILAELVIPELYSSIESLVISLPGYANHLVELIGELLKKNPDVQEFLMNSIKGFTTDITVIADKLKNLIPNINTLITGVSSSVMDIVRMLLNILIGVIVSIYVLKDKEKLAAQSKRLLYSLCSVKKANSVIAVTRLTNDKFGNFITGKIFDSIIIGVLCFIILSIFRIPYTALVSVVVGVTNVIPFFGPFIGAVPSALLILLAEPIKCLTFVIIIIALQQFDGNILGPKILGSSTGVSSFWVMFSILVGSGLFGFWGMLCGVPVFAVIYAIVSESCRCSLEDRGLDYSTEDFKNIDHLSDKTEKPIYYKENN